MPKSAQPIHDFVGLIYDWVIAYELDDLAFRESVFAWLRVQMLSKEAFSREELAGFVYHGQQARLVGPQTGIWRVKSFSEAAISILTAYVPEGGQRPYEDAVGVDGMLRYKWRGTNPKTADNVWLRTAMQLQLPLVWFMGIGYRDGSKTQEFAPQFPVWLVAEEPEELQFVVSIDESQKYVGHSASAEVIEISRRYNERIVRTRHHQPLFRAAVLHLYQRRCAICKLPFAELLDAAHIKSDAEGGAAVVTNGLALCKIHHGAFDNNIIGITPDYRVKVKESVLATFDGPTLHHSIKEMDGELLRQLPQSRNLRPDRDLLAERYVRFLAAK